MQPAGRELLAALVAVLNRWGRWYLFGAQAVVAHGVPRLSADVDVTVRLVPDEPDRFVRDMEAAGFALAIQDPDFVRETRVLPFIHTPTAFPLDVVFAASGLEDEFLERAKTTDIGGVSVPLIDVADLVVAKILAGRPKDIEDVRGLWRLHGPAVDHRRVHRLLRSLETALDRSGLLSAFETVRRTTAPPSEG